MAAVGPSAGKTGAAARAASEEEGRGPEGPPCARGRGPEALAPAARPAHPVLRLLAPRVAGALLCAARRRETPAARPGVHPAHAERRAPVVPPRPRREERPRRLAQGRDLEALPALASDEVLEGWRLRMVDSALRFARLSDVPHSMLARCGAISLV